MASHDLSNTKTKILGATPGAIPGIDGNPHERFSFAPAFSERFFSRVGVVPARQREVQNCKLKKYLVCLQSYQLAYLDQLHQLEFPHLVAAQVLPLHLKGSFSSKLSMVAELVQQQLLVCI